MLRAALLFLAALPLLAQPRTEHGLHFTTPVTTWDEAIPLGNGIIGALLWGDGHPIRISLDRADLWDLRPVPEFHSPDYTYSNVLKLHRAGRHDELKRLLEDPYHRPAPTKIPAGRIEIRLPAAATFRSTSLTLARPEARIDFSSGHSLRAFIHATNPIGMVEIVSPSGSPSLQLVPPPFSGNVAERASGGISPGDLAQLGYPAPQLESGDNFYTYTQLGAQNFRFAIHLAWLPRGQTLTLAWSIASSFESANPAQLARRRVNQALARGYDATLNSAHAEWWRRYWAQSSLRVPNPVLERMWYQETYKFGAASRRGAPPITLQAVWTADNGQLPPWKGDYHHDLNTQLSYWPSYSANHLDEQLAYLDWLWKTRPASTAWTRQFFQLPGLNVPMTADLNGAQIGGWRQYTHSATTAAWLSHHFYLHWKFSADYHFLRHRAYPYLRDSATFLAAWWALPDKLFSSPEINDNKPDAWFDQPTNYDLALSRWLFAATAEAALALNLRNEANRWLDTLHRLPQLALGDDGRLLVAPNYPLPVSHRHFSHLMAIHPLGLIDVDDGLAAKQTQSASLAELNRLGSDWWTGYSFSWLANLAARARDGAQAERALEIFATAFCLRNSFHCNGDQSGKGYSRFNYRPFTLEGNFAAAAGLQEMLLQSHRGVVRVFPAIPAHWKDVSFSNLRAMGAFLVSATLTGGQLTHLEVIAEKGGKLRLAYPGSTTLLELDFKPGERRQLLGAH